MFGAYFKGSDLIAFPLVGLGFFVLLFVAAVRRAVKHRPDSIRQMAAMPLADDTASASRSPSVSGAQHD